MSTPWTIVADNVESKNEEIYFSSRLDNSIKRNGKLVSLSLIRADLLAVDGVLGYFVLSFSLNLSEILSIRIFVRFSDYLVYILSIAFERKVSGNLMQIGLICR